MLPCLLAFACKLPLPDGDGDGHLGSTYDDTATEGSVDADHDGYGPSVDCNDHDPSVHPGAKETCGNGQDDNCNGEADGCEWSGEGTLEGMEIAGSQPEQLFGSTLAVCDANGDGQQDLVVGATGADEYAGRVHVFYGPLGEEESGAWAILGTGADAGMGFSLDCGDTDDDGAAELLIGEPDESGVNPGTMYVVPGGETGVTEIADAFTSAWTGVYAGDRLGYGVVAVDADGDGIDEVAVTSLGVWGQATQYGVTYIVGSSPGTHSAHSAGAYVFGTASRALKGTSGNAGDMDGDGIDELAVTSDVGLYLGDLVLLYQQPLIGALASDDADAVIGGDSFHAGWTRLSHADMNGDGYDDFLIGSAGAGVNDGAVLVFHGTVVDDGPVRHPDLELLGREGSFTGKAIASPGDLDGDDKAELLIGAPGAGGVYLYRGGDSGRIALDDAAQASWWREEDASNSGAALAVGELTGDAIGDFAIGAPYAGDENQGAVVLVPSFDL